MVTAESERVATAGKANDGVRRGGQGNGDASTDVFDLRARGHGWRGVGRGEMRRGRRRGALLLWCAKYSRGWFAGLYVCVMGQPSLGFSVVQIDNSDPAWFQPWTVNYG